MTGPSTPSTSLPRGRRSGIAGNGHHAGAAPPLDFPSLERKLAFLQTPKSWGETVERVDCIETHMSWVFLIAGQVFKLKKPVRFPFLDFTSLQAREFYCREEIRLNSRLAPGIYQGVLALQWQQDGFALIPAERLPARGETVDWLVCMRRLPAHRMLHQLIAAQGVVAADVDALVERLAGFYRSAPACTLSADAYLVRFQRTQAANREVLLRPQFGLASATRAIDQLDQALDKGAPLLRERATRHRVVEGHGDLRPEHVCLLHPPVVIDCLEFNALLRQVDPFDEIAHLGLECDIAGCAWIGVRLVSGLAEALGDPPPAALLHLYAASRALLRARLAMAHLLDPQPRMPQRWAPLADRYIGYALGAIDRFAATTPCARA